MSVSPQRRALVVDDNPKIHEDFRKILAPAHDSRALDAAESALFGESDRGRDLVPFEITSALQGDEAVEIVANAVAAERPFSIAFVDIRMPPGPDGVETARAIWAVDPNVQIVLATAYSDYDWEHMVAALGHGDNFLILKKPFDAIEVRQLAHALSEKWFLARENDVVLKWVEQQVQQRTELLDGALERLRVEAGDRLKLEQELRREHKVEVLGRLVASIGHEINNPLAYVMANVEYGLEELRRSRGAMTPPELDSLCSVLEEAAAGAERIRRIVRGVRDFTRLGEEPASAVDVRRSLETALRLVGNQVRQRARLIAAFAETPVVRADPIRLEQVFVNLLMNAVQALSEGDEHEIRITTEVVDERVVVAVSDTGRGIAEADLERAFEPFFSTRAEHGTGLGLWICRKIVESFGGTIDIESKVGAGTVVRVSLPAAVRDAALREVAPAASAADPRGTVTRARILLVDDEPAVLRGLRRQLGVHDVFTTTSAREAIQAYEAGQFDLVFCDVMMPGFGGVDLLRELELMGPEHAGRVVLMTGGVFTDGVRDALATIKNPCMQKPLDTVEVLRFIERRLSHVSAEKTQRS